MGSIGPNSYLPGDIIPADKYEKCEEHEDRPAVKVLIGECDSMGSETTEMCQECYDKHVALVKQRRENPDPENFLTCESCNTKDATVRGTRDPEEGRSGPVYQWCSGCRNRILSSYTD